MSRFNKVHARVWNDEKSATLSDRARLAFLFVMTHPHLTAIGALRHTLPGMAAELRWRMHACRKAFAELSEKGLVRYSEQAALVWIPNYLRDYPPESPQVVASWVAVLDILPECELRNEMLVHVTGFITSLDESFRRTLPEAFRLAKFVREPNPQPSADRGAADSHTAAGSHRYETPPQPVTGQVRDGDAGQFPHAEPPALPHSGPLEPYVEELIPMMDQIRANVIRDSQEKARKDYAGEMAWIDRALQKNRDRLESEAAAAGRQLAHSGR